MTKSKSQITLLNISCQDLTELPEDLNEYTSLTTLICCHNSLATLDDNLLPPTLKKLFCVGNEIRYLDNLPQGLEELNCSKNEITSLDHLPQGLLKLKCCENKITSLENLPQSLRSLCCQKNKINWFYRLPPNLSYFNYDCNPIVNTWTQAHRELAFMQQSQTEYVIK